jgi:hypothetical protein
MPANHERRLPRLLLVVLGTAALAWAAAVAYSGGFVLQTPAGRLSSRDAVRPLVLGFAALLAYAGVFRQHAAADLARVRARLSPPLAATLLAAATLVIGIHWGSFVAAGSDASGYVSQARRWADGTLIWVAPVWAQEARWEGAVWTAAPLGYRPLGYGDRLVPTYSPGLPLMMAGAAAVAGRDAMFAIVPLLGALAIGMTFRLGAAMGSAWGGVIGACLVLVSPAFLQHLVQPMSDVPVAAFWAVALWAAARNGTGAALLAGAAAAAAIVTRPNLAPLAGIVALTAFFKDGGRWRDVVVFALPILPAAGFIAVVNSEWYGSPLQSGYGNLRTIYAVQRIWPNLRHYAGWWADTQTPLAALAFAAPVLLARSRDDRRTLLLTAIAFPVSVLAMYLAYFEFESWTYLRFLLPAYPPLFAATGAVMADVVRRSRRPRLAAAASGLLVAAAGWQLTRHPDTFFTAANDERYVRAAEYVAALPTNSVFVSLAHSGSIHYYARRDVLRWELLEPHALDGAVAFLRAKGQEVYLVGDTLEIEDFRRRFAGSEGARALARIRPATISGVDVYPLGGSAAPPP